MCPASRASRRWRWRRSACDACGHVGHVVERDDGVPITVAMLLDELGKAHLRSADGECRKYVQQMNLARSQICDPGWAMTAIEVAIPVPLPEYISILAGGTAKLADQPRSPLGVSPPSDVLGSDFGSGGGPEPLA